MHPLQHLDAPPCSARGGASPRRCRCPRPPRWPRRRKATSICGSRIRSRWRRARRSKSSNSFPTAARIAANSSPILQAWIKTAPADVQFRRVPVMFQERWVPLAKIYYTLEALGEEARLSPEVFVAVHGKGLSLWQDKTFFDWAASQGPRPQEGRGHVQLVRDRRQGQPCANDRAGLPGAIRSADRRRRQVRQQSRCLARARCRR